MPIDTNVPASAAEHMSASGELAFEVRAEELYRRNRLAVQSCARSCCRDPRVMTTAPRDPLKTLRLSGMLETLDDRLTQAQKGELGHLDFLQVLCQDEITRRESVALEPHLRRAKFEQQAPLGGLRLQRFPEAARRPDP